MGQEHSQGAGGVRNAPALQWAQGHPNRAPWYSLTLLAAPLQGAIQVPQVLGHIRGRRVPGVSHNSAPAPTAPHPVLAAITGELQSPATKGARGLPLCPLTWLAVGSSRVGTRPTEEEEEKDRHEEGARSRHGGC